MIAHAEQNLEDWVFVKQRGATAHSGDVYRSLDGSLYLRTGKETAIRREAECVTMAGQSGFPVPEVTEIGQLPGGLGYFVERSAGAESFADSFGREYAVTGSISGEAFDVFLRVSLNFLTAQINPLCRQNGPSELRTGIQLANVGHQNPELANLFERAVALAEQRLRKLPLVLTHGDLSLLNMLPGGVIDFEERFVAPAGLDAVTAIAFHHFWDHPMPDGAGTMRLWDFNQQQVAAFLAQADAIFAKQGLPALSIHYDDFFMLKAIWALSYEKPDDLQSPQVQRWLWRKRVAVYCAECVLADKPITSENFRAVGLKETE